MGPGLPRPAAQTIAWQHVHVKGTTRFGVVVRTSDNTYLMHKTNGNTVLNAELFTTCACTRRKEISPVCRAVVFAYVLVFWPLDIRFPASFTAGGPYFLVRDRGLGVSFFICALFTS